MDPRSQFSTWTHFYAAKVQSKTDSLRRYANTRLAFRLGLQDSIPVYWRTHLLLYPLSKFYVTDYI